ncbi:MAG: hypothetical protein ABIU95_12095 [Burkholderiales bacterium]
MYVPNNTPGDAEIGVAKKLLMFASLIVLGCVAIGFAMAQTRTPLPGVGATPTPTPSSTPRGAYQIRCWQYGRLVLEEQLAQLPPDIAGQTLKLQGAQGPASAYSLLNTGTTTCLVKPSNERWAYIPGTR